MNIETPTFTRDHTPPELPDEHVIFNTVTSALEREGVYHTDDEAYRKLAVAILSNALNARANAIRREMDGIDKITIYTIQKAELRHYAPWAQYLGFNGSFDEIVEQMETAAQRLARGSLSKKTTNRIKVRKRAK